jgi:hypothetical protein
MRITPSRRPFFKYASPAATLAILETGKVRYSTPLRFNDPFDVQAGLHFDFDLHTLHNKVIDRLEVLASAPAAPPVDPDDVWGQLVLEARKHFPEFGFHKEHWRQMTGPSFAEIEAVIRHTQEDYRLHWREKLLPGLRVFCVSEERDNLLMWAHYAQDHSGAVFEFWSLPEEDNPLSVAQPVVYADSPPPFFTEAEWVDDFMGVKKLDASALYQRYAYVKSRHWEHEKEWRVWYPLATSEDHDYIAIHPKELKAVYIGCQAGQDFKKKVVEQIRYRFPEAAVLQAVKSEIHYRLEYTDA